MDTFLFALITPDSFYDERKITNYQAIISKRDKIMT